MSAAAKIPSVRVFIAGNSGSGKTTLAERMYLSRYPRRLILDLTGEWEGKVDATAYSVREAQTATADLARGKSGRWSVAMALGREDMPALVQWLVPVPRVQESPIVAVGGAVLLVDEVDLLAPPSSASEAIRTLYRRSRHVGLSVVSTTQRPANVSREVSAQSTHAVALLLNEQRDVDYIASLMRWDLPATARWRQWTKMHPHGAVWRDLQTQQTLWIPGEGPPSSQGPTGPQLEAFDGDDAP